MPGTVTILDGQASASFNIDAVDDALVDGTQSVTITASATGYTSGTDSVDVTDDETATAPSSPQSTTTYDKRPEEGDPAGSKLDEKL